MTDELKELGDSVKSKFSQAVSTGRDYDWADHNLAKRIYQKSLTLAKNQYFASTLTGARHIWNYIKTISGGSKISIPTCIIEGGNSITSNAIIANIMNSYFIVKIAAIVASFTQVSYDELIFLKNLIANPDKKFNLPPISIDETGTIIKQAKNSASRGYNNTNMRFIKLNPKAFAPFITIAINRSIAAGVFPDNMKVAKILPILKPGKNRFKKESYRPISNLHCLEKIYEEHVKMPL